MKKRLFFIIVSSVLFVFSMVIKFENSYINNLIFFISYLLVGFKVLKKAIKNILRGKLFDENFLMSIATVGAFFVGEYPEAVMVMILYQLGELFQDYAVEKSRKSIASLMDIRPDYANVLRNDQIEKVNPADIAIDEIIVVKPGEKVPLDGIIIEGISMVDTTALTGESVPTKLKVNDEILSGTINQTGVIKVKVKKEFGESTVNKILDMVENATSKKSDSEKFITKFAKYYTPSVVVIALFLAFVPPIFINEATFMEWIYKALSFLVVSCPCALVISIPLGFFGGIGGASKSGILVKGSNSLEDLAQTETVVFDKTGTLTEGVFEVQKIESLELENDEFIRIVAHTENFSNHPVAESIKNFYKKDINEDIIECVKEISGCGIFAKVENKEILVGNDKLMLENNIDYTKCYENGTVIYVAINNKFAGYILISDKIKEDSEKAIEELKKQGIKKIVMLTGDKASVAQGVVTKLKIDEFYAELLPNNKVEKLEELMLKKSAKGKIIFAGDGINDAPVLVTADIGIAMGGMGSDAAIEASDIVIMTDEPLKISTAIKISKKTMRIVKENIIFALTVKFLVLILTIFGISTMWSAVFADVGVSIIAILNSLRMLKVKRNY